jgi:N-alpha-acetyltransferase 15/16, NatA auxiliary subunit
LNINNYTGEKFKSAAGAYMKPALRKGVPSLFVNMKKLYSDSSKSAIIEELMEGYRQLLNDKGVFEESTESDTREPPTAYLWTLYFLAQHYDYKGDTTKAIKYIGDAIEHTPTVVELYMTKGRIFKVGKVKRMNFIPERKKIFFYLRSVTEALRLPLIKSMTSMGAT